jgi:RNA polymerase sigma-70 factor (ECF subfamily)
MPRSVALPRDDAELAAAPRLARVVLWRLALVERRRDRMQEFETTRPDVVLTPTPRWIQALHLDLVGRLPDPKALGYWLTSARSGASHREIAGELVRSEAYCHAQIAALYRALLDRDGTPEELAAWTSSLRAGIALQDAIAGLCDGCEYKANHAGAAAFVESLYQRLLDRASDPDGKAAWLAALDHRASTLSVIRGVLASTEYCALRATELHERMLGREPGDNERSERSLELMHGTPLQQVVVGFATSAEYIARAETRAVGPAVSGAADPAGVQIRPAPRLPPPDEAAPAPSAVPSGPRGLDPDEDVLVLVTGGNHKLALQRLMQRHGAAVYRYCLIAVGDAALADDVHQQVFIEAFRDLPRFARRSTLRTWLLGIARHRVLDAAKRRRRARNHVETARAADLPDLAPSAGDGLDDAELRAALASCVAQLEEPARTAVLLRYQQTLTYEEMAVICGEKPGTLQARVSRALRRLRAMIDDDLAHRHS